MRHLSFEISSEDLRYPPLLKYIHDYPGKIYVKGEYNEHIFDNTVAFIGSRKMTYYGKKCLDYIISGLNKKVTVVSGFMYGADCEAHKISIQNKLKTIAVMPCGVECIHPENQADLYNDIINSGGLLLSEYEGDFKPHVWTYPRRNRITAGICKAVVVVEAGPNSGTLMTANLANKYNRKVFAIPGSIFSLNQEGISWLLNNYAKPLKNADDINTFLGLSVLKCATSSLFDENNEILLVLNQHPMSIDELSRSVNEPMQDLLSKITILTLENKIIEKGGILYAR